MQEFRKIKSLGVGGMGEVVLVARERGEFRRLYAIKRLHPQFAAQKSHREMFFNEARIAGLLRHANIVSVQDVGEDDQGPFLVMDFVEGITVGDLLGNLKNLPLLLILTIIERTARGLHAVHTLRAENGDDLKVIHRDVSPHNILLGYDGAVRLADFGVAKALYAQEVSGTIKGKIGYMSPEQLRSDPLDQRSDLFALGTVLFELLSGRRLYRGDDAIKGILEDPPPDIVEERDDVPPQIVQLLFGLLAKSAENRPKSALNVAETLADAISDLHGELGAFDMAEFMSTTFAERREALRLEIADALNERYDTKTEQFLLKREVVEQWHAESRKGDNDNAPPTIVDGHQEATVITSRSRWTRFHTGAVSFIALVGVCALIVWWTPSESVTPTVTQLPATTPVNIPAKRPSPNPVPELDEIKTRPPAPVQLADESATDATKRTLRPTESKRRVVRVGSKKSNHRSTHKTTRSKEKKPVWSAVPDPQFRWMGPKKRPK